MAEYYPLISRAVAGLRNGTPEARRAIYDRAKQALIGQLRAMQPPVPEEDIARESVALDEAIARVEADFVVQAAPEPAPAPPPPIIAPPAVAPPAVAVTAPIVTASSPAASAADAPALGGFRRPERPAPVAARLPLRPPVSRPAYPAKPKEPAGEPDPAPPDPAPESPSAESTGLPAAALPVASTLQVLGAEQATPDEAPLFRPSAADGPTARELLESDGATRRNADEFVRPAAPRPAVTQKPDLRVFIVAFAALAAVIAVAFTAWKLRDKPEALTRTPSVSRQAEPAVGKIVERADGTSATDAGSPATATSPPGVAANPDTSAPAAATAAAVPATPAAVDPSVPIAYKAAVLIDAPEEAQKVKTYVGTVVWRTETVNPGQDQQVGTAIRGDIDIPDAKMKLSFEMRKNTEPQFPASHTLELKFALAADSPLGGVKQINVPQMRREDMPTGDPLSGVPVTITDNYFLVGLTRGSYEETNLELIRTRSWFDIPMLLSNGKAAKVTFEKGQAGERIINDVLQSWKTAPN